jgi:ABC-type enterochelin transport system substrate-binding protein
VASSSGGRGGSGGGSDGGSGSASGGGSGSDGAQLAKDVMDNGIINATRAAQEGHLVILGCPAAWYTAEGGVTALDYMISDLESVLA